MSHPLRQRHQEILLHTGQHYDATMSERFFSELNLPRPDVELGVGSASHGEQTAKMLTGIEAAIAEHRPDAVLVYGDTNSTLAGALAAVKMHVPVAHVEAGLRSFNRTMPEEINRIVTDRVSSLLFCPSATAVRNLAVEGITRGVHDVGDVMWDVLSRFAPAGDDCRVVDRYHVQPNGYCVATIHRAENTDDAERFSAILHGIGGAARPVLFPAHPRLRELLSAAVVPPNITVLDPAGYAEMIALVRNAHAVITDSGGLQKEAYWVGTPCVTVRAETEWVETIAAGWNTLVEPAGIAAAVRSAARRPERPVLYGEGGAAAAIANLIGTLSAARRT